MPNPANWEGRTFWLALAKAAALLVVAIGTLVLLGWTLDSALLKSILPHWVAMKANTATGLLLLGAALWLKAADYVQPNSRRLTLTRVLAGLVVLLGLFSLLEFLVGVDLGIDQWLFQEPPDAIHTLAPGRMAPATALCFVLLGSALLPDGKTLVGSRVVFMLAACAGLMALASGLLYLYSTDNYYGFGVVMQLAAHTVLALILLALGILCAQPEHGVVALLRSRDSGGALTRRLLPVTLLLPVLIGWLKLGGERLGLYEPDLGVALIALTYILILSTLVVWVARFLSRSERERSWMNAAVSSSEARARALVNTIPDPVWLKNPEGIYLACNPAFERFFGAKERDIVGKTDYDFVPRGLADAFRANDQAAIAAGAPHSNEEWISYPDGQRVLLETTKAPMFGETGNLLGVLGIARDITLRYRSEQSGRAARAEAERLLEDANRSRQVLLSVLEDSEASSESLLQSEARFVSLFNAIADAVYVHEVAEGGAPSKFLEVNDVACKLTGYTRGELLGMTPQQLDDPNSGVDAKSIVRRLVDGAPATFEQVHLGKGGRRIPVEINSRLFTLNGRPVVISIARDITERKLAQHKLAESERHFHSLFENMLDGYAYCRMFYVDGKAEDFIYLDVNAAFETLTGLKDVVGKHVSDVIPGIRQSNPEMFAVYGRVALSGQSEKLETYVEPLKSWFSIAIYSPGPHHFVAVFDNITERKRVEAEIRQLNDELEQRVLDRTARLAAVNKELETFSYSVSHDLRAPLRAIAGFVELLRKHSNAAIDDKGRHYMEMIAESAVQMGRLIDAILSFSRLGRAELSMAKVDMNRLLDEVLITLLPQTDGRQVEWKIGTLPEVQGERTMLSLVLLNLVGNALKFTQPRALAVIEIGCNSNNPDETVCYIKDNGVGFDMQHADKLFALFQRLHPHEQFEGTGVGLANVQRIIQRHGGRVWAEGEQDEGATFYFALPKSGS